MAVSPSLDTIGSGYNLAKINSNFTKVAAAFQDVVSLSGVLPNAMNADFDMNGNDVLNGGVGNFHSLFVNGTDVHNIVGLPGPTGPTGPAGGINTSITGILKGNGTIVSAATPGTDFYAPGSTDVAVADGGTNFSSYTTGDILYASASTVLSKLPKGSALQTLRQNSSLTAPEWANAREVLTGVRNYFIGYNMGAATISIASPGVVTKASHGLVADSRVSFSILPNHKAATISIASPAVVTVANTFSAGQPIKFSSTGRLPTGVTIGTTYFVIATGLSTSSFQFSATVGGTAINTSNPTVTISNASPGVVTLVAHGLSITDPIQFATTGTLPTGLTAGTVYFVKTTPTADTFTVSSIPEGTSINTSSAGSGTHTLVQHGSHLIAETGSLPTGLTAGFDYFVLASGLTTNTFTFAGTSGGSAIITTGSTNGTIVIKTGSDNNDGKTSSPTGAFLTHQKAFDVVSSLDIQTNNVTLNMADGTYLNAGTVYSYWVGSGDVSIVGNLTFPGNVVINPVGLTCFEVRGRLIISGGFELRGNVGVFANAGSISISSGMRYGTANAYNIYAFGSGSKILMSSYDVVGNSIDHLVSQSGGTILCTSQTIRFFDRPICSSTLIFAAAPGAYVEYFLNTFLGYPTGTRFGVVSGALISSNGAGINYIPGTLAGSGTNYGVAPYGLYA